MFGGWPYLAFDYLKDVTKIRDEQGNEEIVDRDRFTRFDAEISKIHYTHAKCSVTAFQTYLVDSVT